MELNHQQEKTAECLLSQAAVMTGMCYYFLIALCRQHHTRETDQQTEIREENKPHTGEVRKEPKVLRWGVEWRWTV